MKLLIYFCWSNIKSLSNPRIRHLGANVNIARVPPELSKANL